MKAHSIQMKPDVSDISSYLDVLECLGKNTETYFYLWEIENNRIWIFGDLDKLYPLMDKGDRYCTIERWNSSIHPDDRAMVLENMRRIRQEQSFKHVIRYRLRNRDGNYVWVTCRGSYRAGHGNNSPVLIGMVSDTELRYKVDELTGLYNMAIMKKDLQKILRDGDNGYFLLLGVDNMKQSNVTHGRETGDHILQYIASVLEECAEANHLYRAEKDYFVLCMMGTSQIDVQTMCEKIQKGLPGGITVSVGAVSFETVGAGEEKILYQYAEYALDKAKRAGKDRLEFFNLEEYQAAVFNLELLEELRRSIRKNFDGFFLMYQPQVKGDNYQLAGTEALLRYQSQRSGMIGPDVFIPILENTGMICQVGLWVLKTALAQCLEWRKQVPDFNISVNMSYVQMNQAGIVEQVLDILNQSGLPGSALTLEITESMQLKDYGYFNDIFARWRSTGIQISIDDFGTGYSSLSYLKYLKVDEIKTDQCFIREIDTSTYNYQLLKHIMELSTSANIRVCCEGVEIETELQVLEDLVPDLLQGFLFAKPMTPEAFQKNLFVDSDPSYQSYGNRLKQFKRNRYAKILKVRQADILKITGIGLWMFLISADQKHYELYADETVIRQMGVDEALSPEETFAFWYSRIVKEDVLKINQIVKQLINDQKIQQVQYRWMHPQLGEVQLHSTGIRGADLNGMICIVGDHRVERKTDSKKTQTQIFS